MVACERNGCLCVILLAALFFLASCSHLERLEFPLQSGVDSRLRQKEVVRIDKDVYVKVPNPEARMGENHEPYIYVSAREYLSNPERYDHTPGSTPALEQGQWVPAPLETQPSSTEQGLAEADRARATPHFKKKLVVLPFEDISHPADKGLSDIFMAKLTGRIEAVSDEVALIDSAVITETRPDQGIDRESLLLAEWARRANRQYGIHAVITGVINHVFVSSKESPHRGRDGRAYGIAEINASLIDAGSGTVLQEWEHRNPVFDSEEQGDFSKEKAQLRAIELIASQLGQAIVDTLKGLDWYTTIADVDGDRVYISAGKFTGVRVGDTFLVYPAAIPSDPKGEVRVSRLFGLDASVADITRGEGLRPTDLVKPVFQ